MKYYSDRFVLFFLLIVLMLFVGCSKGHFPDEVDPIQAVKVANTNLAEGAMYARIDEAIHVQTNVEDTQLIFVSSAPEVATINATGHLSMLRIGTTNVQISYQSGEGDGTSFVLHSMPKLFSMFSYDKGDSVAIDFKPYVVNDSPASFSFSLNSDIEGLSLSSTTGQLAGTLDQSGAFERVLTVTVMDDQTAVYELQQSILMKSSNSIPIMSQGLLDHAVQEDFSPIDVALGDYFSDPDGDSLVYSVMGDDGQIVQSGVNLQTLTISPVANSYGFSTIKVIAEDPSGAQVSDNFSVTVTAVNDGPVVSNPVLDMVANKGDPARQMDLSNVFSDVDGHSLTYSVAENGDPTNVVTGVVTDSILKISFSDTVTGSATVDVTASDGTLSVKDTFSVNVNQPSDTGPKLVQPLSDIQVNEDADNTIVSLGDVFTDEGDLTYSIEVQPASILTASIDGDRLTLDYIKDQYGTVNGVVTATDADGNRASDVFLITVLSVNDLPYVANALSDLMVDEGSNSKMLDLSNVFADSDGDSLSYDVLSSDPKVVGASIDSNSLQLVFLPDMEGVSNLTVTATDRDGGSVSDSVVVRVVAVNDPPAVAQGLGDIAVPEDASGTVLDLGPVFSDLDQDTLTYSVSLEPSDTSVVSAVLDGSNLKLDYGDNEYGDVTVNVTATDPGQLSVMESFHIAVSSQNDVPSVANSMADVTVAEDAGSTVVDLTDIFSDVEDQNLTYSVNLIPSDTSVLNTTLQGSQLTLDYVEHQNGKVTVNVVATDDQGGAVEDSIMVTVTSVNDAPIVAEGISDISALEGSVDKVLDVGTVFSDPDGDTVTYFVSLEPHDTSVLQASLDGTNLTLDYGVNQHGDVTVNLMAVDPAQSFVVDSFQVRVSSVEDTPVVFNALADVAVLEGADDTVLDLSSVFSDPDGQDLTYSVDVVPQGTSVLTATVGGNNLTLDYGEDQNGTVTVNITATDASGLKVVDTVLVNVMPVKDAPVVSNALADVTVLEDSVDSVLDLSSVFSDPDGDSLTYSVELVPQDTSVLTKTLVGTSLSLDYSDHQNGTVTVNITAADSAGLQVMDTVLVTVTPVNDAPVVGNALTDVVVLENDSDTELNLSSVFSDLDNDTLTYFATLEPIDTSVLTAVINGSNLTLDYEPNQNGDVTVNVIAVDEGQLLAMDAFRVQVNPVEYTPTVQSPISDISVAEDAVNTVLDLSSVFSDPDGEALTYSVSLIPQDTSILTTHLDGTSLTLDYADDQNGEVTLTITATDTSGLTAVDTVPIIVTAVNDDPIVSNALSDVTVIEDSANTVLPLGSVFSDPEGKSLTYSVSVVPADTSVLTTSLAGSDLTLNYGSNQNGDVTLSITATDDLGGTVVDTVVVKVTPKNDTPTVANPITDISVAEDAVNTVLDLGSVFSDPDGQDLTYSVDVVPQGTSVLTATVGGNNLTLDYADNQNGKVTLNVTATDPDGLTTADTVLVTVTPVDDAPIVSNALANVTVVEDAADSVLDIASVFSDPDGQVLTYSVDVVPQTTAVLTATLVGTTLTLDYGDNQNGTVTVNVTATDPTGLKVVDAVLANVTPVNDAPVVGNSLADIEALEDATDTVLDLGPVFSDPEGDALTYSVSLEPSDTSVLAATLDGSTLTLDYLANQSGVVTVHVLATDPSGEAVSDLIRVTVTPVSNGPPAIYTTLVNLVLQEGGAKHTIDLSSYFSDPDNRTLTYGVAVDSGGLISASVVSSELEIQPITDQNGVRQISVIATDDKDPVEEQSVTQIFKVTVVPVFSTAATNPLADVDVGVESAPVFVDIDQDGDQDSILGSMDGSVLYYKNIGDSNSPDFQLQEGAQNPFKDVSVGINGENGYSVPDFVDMDGDQDLDLFVGSSSGQVSYYKNTGSVNVPIFVEQTGSSNPLNQNNYGSFCKPRFVDIDTDGDKDLFMGRSNGKVDYFINSGGVFTKQSAANNPFTGFEFDQESSPAFVDMDVDGDYDVLVGQGNGMSYYLLNTGTPSQPHFELQTDLANPFYNVDFGDWVKPAFVDIDGDGDLDMFMGESSGLVFYYQN